MPDYVILIIGIGCAFFGGEYFVRGAVAISTALRIAPAIIGVTVAAFATSSPELSVAINSGLTGNSTVALGDALGSNIVNISLILGIALLMSDIPVSWGVVKRDIPVAIIIPCITGILLFDGSLSRVDGIFMFSIFILWLCLTILEATRERRSKDLQYGGKKIRMPALTVLFGLVLLVLSGKLIVSGASGLARAAGLDEFFIGATVVALGTSMPELASLVISKLKGYDEVGLGTVLGSNIFNGLFIISVTVMLSPVRPPLAEVFPALVFGLLSLLLALPGYNSGRIRRRQGIFLLILYFVYLAMLFISSRLTAG